ncbi:MAG: PepSY domain-containing protein, partial [Novibacillus thermophilus]
MNNKTWIAVIVGAVLISVAGLGIQHITDSSDNSQLTTKEIREIVQDKYPGEVEKIELERENGKLVYEAELKGPKGEYEVTLDAFTGDVVNLKEKSPQASQNDDVSKRTTDGT